MNNKVTIRIPFSEVSWGSCYATVELKDGETAKQYLADVKSGKADILLDADIDEWTVDDSDNQSFDIDEAEIYHDD